jgi:NADH dehydrogenase (ubiquinone) 1 alpha subcomplex subunit 9
MFCWKSQGWTGLIENRNFDLEDVHVEGAERIADAVAKYDVDRFIHLSSYNADLNSPSEFFRTKVSL